MFSFIIHPCHCGSCGHRYDTSSVVCPNCNSNNRIMD